MAKTPAHIEDLAIALYDSSTNRPATRTPLPDPDWEGRPVYGHDWENCRPTVRTFYRRLARVAYAHLGLDAGDERYIVERYVDGSWERFDGDWNEHHSATLIVQAPAGVRLRRRRILLLEAKDTDGR